MRLVNQVVAQLMDSHCQIHIIERNPKAFFEATNLPENLGSDHKARGG
tara:strand:+ start:319 stop:462 length:144 start_codon:yes stop_codon:yes gene_type:complete